jgi:transcriptional regulator with XRE-family HTH domain
MEFHEWLIRARKRHGLSQKELGKRAGLSHTAISNVECGKCHARRKNMIKLKAVIDEADAELSLRTSNGDAIRNMPDEELVFYINCQQMECKISPPDRDCYLCKLNWLQREAKGGKV